MINIMLPDGSKMPFEAPVSALQVAEKISPNLAKAAIAAKVNDTLTDLTTPITTDVTLSIITTKTPKVWKCCVIPLHIF